MSNFHVKTYSIDTDSNSSPQSRERLINKIFQDDWNRAMIWLCKKSGSDENANLSSNNLSTSKIISSESSNNLQQLNNHQILGKCAFVYNYMNETVCGRQNNLRIIKSSEPIISNGYNYINCCLCPRHYRAVRHNKSKTNKRCSYTFSQSKKCAKITVSGSEFCIIHHKTHKEPQNLQEKNSITSTISTSLQESQTELENNNLIGPIISTLSQGTQTESENSNLDLTLSYIS